MSWKTSPWIRYKEYLLTRWRLITYILLIVERNSRNQFRRTYCKNQKQSLRVLFHFRNLPENFHILEKRISLIAQIIGKFLTPKNVLPWMPKISCLRTPSGSQSVRGSQALLKSTRNRFYPNFPLIQEKFSPKTSLWIRF